MLTVAYTAIALGCFLTSQLVRYEDPRSAGSRFGHNLFFVFPLFIVAALFAILALLRMVVHHNWNNRWAIVVNTSLLLVNAFPLSVIGFIFWRLVK